MRRPPGTYYNSLTEICGPDGRIFGTGAVISATQVVTCAHVVAAALPDVDENGDFDDIGPDAFVGVRRHISTAYRRSPAVHRFGSFMADRTGRVVRTSPCWSWSMDNSGRSGRMRRSRNLPRSMKAIRGLSLSWDSQKTRPRRSESLQKRNICSVGCNRNSWINAQSIRGHGSEIRSGFSGAPAWSWSKRWRRRADH